MTDDDTAAVLEAWTDELASALGLEAGLVDIDAVLGLAGVVAHAVVRPAAPLTTYLAGYAAGVAAARGDESGFPQIAGIVRDLAARR